MITQAEQQFNIDYRYIRRELIRGRASADMIKVWINARGRVTEAKAIDQVHDEKLRKVFERPSFYERDEREDLKDEDE